MAIPDSMRAVPLTAYDGRPESIAIVEMPVSRPGPSEVLVRVFATPINPSDLVFIRGLYGFIRSLYRPYPDLRVAALSSRRVPE